VRFVRGCCRCLVECGHNATGQEDSRGSQTSRGKVSDGRLEAATEGWVSAVGA
jgi:hypothetical protein